jgi:zinc protease
VKYSFFVSLLILSLVSNSVFAQAKARAQKTAAAATTAKPAEKKQDYAVPFVNKTLPNGLEVIVLQDSSVPLVTVELAVRNGSFTEPPELHGLSHLYEHMFFKPNFAVAVRDCESQTSRFSLPPICSRARELQSSIGDVSYLRDTNKLSISNGSTREEIVNYYYTTTRDYLAAAIRNINDAVRYPVFDEQEFENEKKVVIGEIDRHEANPFGLLDRVMKQKLFSKYPTRKDPQGTRESVGTATIEKMKTIQSRYYVPNNAALIVTGDAKPDEVFKLA